eukprot:PhM_4_TR14779/c0_g1_i2/m.74177/K00981/E2.7.7.41, CDS1, CDS2, cdsA; phosphatidate cytidylyltransferase
MSIAKRGITISIVAPSVCYVLSTYTGTLYLVAALVAVAALEWNLIVAHHLLPVIVSGGVAPSTESPMPQVGGLATAGVVSALLLVTKAALTVGLVFTQSVAYVCAVVVFLCCAAPHATYYCTDHSKSLGPKAGPRLPLAMLSMVLLDVFGFLWVGALSFSVSMYVVPAFGPRATVTVLVANWVNDAGALIAGKALSARGATTKLMPHVSPSKTVEGAVAGVLLNGVAFAISYRSVWMGSVGLGLGVVGVLGDLVESLVKRAAHVKDSGFVFPGHGGVLDRIDGLLIVYPLAHVLQQSGVWPTL